MKKVLVSGCHGQMGQTVCRLIGTHPGFEVNSGFDKSNGLTTSYPVFDSYEDLMNQIGKSFESPDVIVDFSSPAGTIAMLSFALTHKIPLVIATTGLESSMEHDLQKASWSIPVFRSANMSFEITLLKRVLQMIAPQLPSSDIEITETHHNRKADAPSGTAKLLADYINESLESSKEIVYGRAGKRKTNEIGISAIRGGNIVGTHTVQFFGLAETLEITHTVYSRDVFAEGAIKAAEFLIEQQPGLYNMDNLI